MDLEDHFALLPRMAREFAEQLLALARATTGCHTPSGSPHEPGDSAGISLGEFAAALDRLVLRGWALVRAGQADAGIARMKQGLAECRTQSVGVSLLHYCALLAEAYKSVAQITPGLAALTEAFSTGRPQATGGAVR